MRRIPGAIGSSRPYSNAISRRKGMSTAMAGSPQDGSASSLPFPADLVEPASREAMSADPEVLRYLPAPDEVWIARMRAHFAEHRFGQFVVELPGEASFIGAIGLNHVRWNLSFTPAVEAAWRLAPAYWGKGYALEA